MNDTNAAPPRLPEHLQPVPPFPTPPPPVNDPTDHVAIAGLTGAVEAILRQPRRVMHQLRQPGAGGVISAMLFVSAVCALIYGVVVGTFSGGTQLWAAPAKIAAGLLFTGVICLPSLYIFACLSGSQARLVEIAGLVAGLLLLMTVLLIGFAPVAWLFSQSTNSLAWMGALHVSFGLIATFFGLRFLSTGFAQTQAKSLLGLRVWSVIFVLVALQMTTALRPLVGTTNTLLPTEKKFFLAHWAECLDEAPAKQNRGRTRAADRDSDSTEAERNGR